ncbi:MAG: DUF6691 family protein [Alphaproteobacteria bacterium]
MRVLVALASGALFGLGLIVSDMVNPARVLGFLDLAGAWDPTLAFVMGGALIPMAVAWRIAAARPAPVCGATFPGPPAARLDLRLLGGAVLFGAGWGLVGFCPGPALTALGIGSTQAVIFTVAMLAGMFGHGIAFPMSKAA